MHVTVVFFPICSLITETRLVIFAIVSIVLIFKQRIFTRKVIYRLFQLNVWTFQKCKNAHACALWDCLGVSRPFVSDTSPKNALTEKGLERRPIRTRQGENVSTVLYVTRVNTWSRLNDTEIIIITAKILYSKQNKSISVLVVILYHTSCF